MCIADPCRSRVLGRGRVDPLSNHATRRGKWCQTPQISDASDNLQRPHRGTNATHEIRLFRVLSVSSLPHLQEGEPTGWMLHTMVSK